MLTMNRLASIVRTGPTGPKQAAAALTIAFVMAFSIFTAINSPSNILRTKSNTSCEFPAIFNFGDSNSDTGGKSAAFHRRPFPNGVSFFHKPSGRYCDGRVILDFIAEKLGLPYISAYLDSIGSNFEHGANFATGGSTIQPLNGKVFEAGFSPISLDIQLLQFEQFKERATELYNQGARSLYTKRLPKPEDFSRALYALDIGQNDLHYMLKAMTIDHALDSLPDVIDKFAQAVEKLYQLGARTFWIHNTGPIGCLPYSLVFFPSAPENTDQIGCIKSHNNVAEEFNRLLKDRVPQLRKRLPEATLTYTDLYTAKYLLISGAKKQGFGDPFGYCCGHYGEYNVQCGGKAIVNGTEISADLCSNPESYISWDGVHYSQAANLIVANAILDGSLSDPPVPIHELCQKHAGSL